MIGNTQRESVGGAGGRRKVGDDFVRKDVSTSITLLSTLPVREQSPRGQGEREDSTAFFFLDFLDSAPFARSSVFRED